MAASDLCRFDLRVMRNTFASEMGQNSLGNARFSFFEPGATVSTPATIATGSNTLEVFDTGALKVDSTVLINLGPKELSVTAINSRTSITVNNTTGASISIPRGTRLLLVSEPAAIYFDPDGASPVTDGNSFSTNPGSIGGLWIPSPFVDQLSTAELAVDFVTSPPQTLTGAHSTLSWSHASSGSGRLVVVGVSWLDGAREETLDSVTYDGVAMTLVSSTSRTALYALVDPPTDWRTIVVTWSGSNAKGAIASAISFTGVDQDHPYDLAGSASGNSTSPSVTAVTSRLPSMIFGLLGIDAGSSAVTVNAGSLTTEWNSQAGSAGTLTLTQGAAAILAPTALSSSFAWSLSGGARAWDVMAIALHPMQIIKHGLPSGVSVGAQSVDARHYADLQAAVDAVAPGGTVHIPNGDYSSPDGGLIINKSLCIEGEPGTHIYPFAATADQPAIRIAPSGTHVQNITIRDLAILNPSPPSGVVSGNYGIHCDVPADGSKLSRLVIERVVVTNMGDDGISLEAQGDSDSFIVFASLRDVTCASGRHRGLFASFTNLLDCSGCLFIANDYSGVRAERSEPAFYACAFESNCKSNHIPPDEDELNSAPFIDPMFDAQVTIKDCSMSRLDACHFENFRTAGHFCNRALVLINSPCSVISGCLFFNPDLPTESDDDRGIYCTFGATMDTPVPGVVAASILPNLFVRVKTPIEIDTEAGTAKDCVVFPQRIEGSDGVMILPTGVSDSGTVALGNRRLGAGGLARGIFVPPRENILPSGGDPGNPLPDLTGDDAGYVLFDSTSHTLSLWDGSTWRPVTLG